MGSATQVLIAGAGPTGLTLAIELARRNIPHRVVDAATDLFKGSRGKGLQPRTLEVFEDLGVLNTVHASGGPYPRFRIHLGPIAFRAGGMHVVREPTPSVPYPNVWMLPQWRTNEILLARLQALGGHVELGSRLCGFEQDAYGVTATLAMGTDVEHVRAEYLVGCDGGHSLVRKTLGVRFEGEMLEPRPMLLADIEIEGLDRSHWHLWPFAKGRLLTLCPLPGTSRFQLAAPLPPLAVLPDPTENAIRDFVESRIGGDGRLRVGAITWISVYRAHVRMVDRYRVGRVLLGGDAAHVHPPTGGQGLNTGIQDAYNLGWKLANVLRGAPETLLDTYESERLPIAAGVLGLSKRLLRTKTAKRGAESQQLGLNYRGSPLSVDDVKEPGPVRAGDRAPDAPCVDADGTPRRLFEIFRGTHLTLLAFDVCREELMAGMPAVGTEDVKVVRVLRHGELASAEAVIDNGGHARRAYGVGDAPALVLVRPDGYIGYLGSPGSWIRLDHFLSSVLTESSFTVGRN